MAVSIQHPICHFEAVTECIKEVRSRKYNLFATAASQSSSLPLEKLHAEMKVNLVSVEHLRFHELPYRTLAFLNFALYPRIAPQKRILLLY